MAKVILPRSLAARGFPPEPPAAPVTRAPISLNATPERHEHILLLEDEAQTNMILREYLESLGYKVVAVANGVDGLKEVIKSDFELVICDMMMPQLPGDMFFLAVQRTRPNLCKRFVFITGHQENPKVDEFIQKTNSAILVKPFRLQQLEATLEGILSRFPKMAPPAAEPEPESEPEPALVLAPRPSIPAPVAAVHEPVPAPARIAPTQPKPATSMVNKALEMVRRFRTAPAPTPTPAPATSQPAPVPAAKITRKIASEPVVVTRRIAHLANTPVAEPSARNQSKAIPRVTRRVTRLIADRNTPEEIPKIKPEITRRVAPLGAMGRIQRPQSRRVTRKVATATPKTARKVPATVRVADVKAHKGAKTTAKITKKVTVKAPARTVFKAASKTATKVTVKALAKTGSKTAPKVTRKTEKPSKAPAPAARVTRRIAMPKS